MCLVVIFAVIKRRYEVEYIYKEEAFGEAGSEC